MKLATFVMKVYIQVWFQIKVKSSCVYGPRHLFYMMESTRYLKPNERKIIDEVLTRNCFFANQENLLLNMMCDLREEIRELAVRRITRNSSVQQKEVRKFITPKSCLNLNALDYIDMIDWSQCEILSPPLLKYVSTDKLH